MNLMFHIFLLAWNFKTRPFISPLPWVGRPVASGGGKFFGQQQHRCTGLFGGSYNLIIMQIRYSNNFQKTYRKFSEMRKSLWGLAVVRWSRVKRHIWLLACFNIDDIVYWFHVKYSGKQPQSLFGGNSLLPWRGIASSLRNPLTMKNSIRLPSERKKEKWYTFAETCLLCNKFWLLIKVLAQFFLRGRSRRQEKKFQFRSTRISIKQTSCRSDYIQPHKLQSCVLGGN